MSMTLLLLFHFEGPETLLRLSSKFFGSSDGFEGDNGDAFEAYQWKCVRTMDGMFLQPRTLFKKLLQANFLLLK